MKRTKEQNKILYTLLAKNKIDLEHKADLVNAFTNGRTDKSSEMTYMECQNMIKYLKSNNNSQPQLPNQTQPQNLDKKRKQVIAAIFKYFELQNKEVTIDYVKGVACRAAGVISFNKITNAALTRIYNEFCKKQKVLSVKNDSIQEQPIFTYKYNIDNLNNQPIN